MAKPNARQIHNPVRGLQSGPADALFVNSPLKNYDNTPRRNNFTLPVLGLGYIATVCATSGLNVGVLDGEALGLGVSQIAAEINRRSPKWVGFNLLAPTYRHTVDILRQLQPDIKVMLGGHQAKALPEYILRDLRIPRVDALILGEAEYRTAALLSGSLPVSELPHVLWRDGGNIGRGLAAHSNSNFLSPDIEKMPFVDREFFVDDPYSDNGLLEAAMVGSRGCPFDCSFCGAARSANRDVTIRSRSPSSLISELFVLKERYGIGATRFVDDLFLSNVKVVSECASAFVSENLGLNWDATGRINILANSDQALIGLLKRSGCREVALGVESGSDRLLKLIDKKILVEQTERAVKRLCENGIHVKAYFILGMPTETRVEQGQTLALIRKLWDMTDNLPGRFRCSVFEYRPYPGTPDWNRLRMCGFKISDLLTYDEVDLTAGGADALLLDRDEFNFTTNLQLSEVPLVELRRNLSAIMREQKARLLPHEASVSGPVPQAGSANWRSA